MKWFYMAQLAFVVSKCQVPHTSMNCFTNDDLPAEIRYWLKGSMVRDDCEGTRTSKESKNQPMGNPQASAFKFREQR